MTPDEWDAWIEEALGRRNVELFERHLIFWLDARPLKR